MEQVSEPERNKKQNKILEGVIAVLSLSHLLRTGYICKYSNKYNTVVFSALINQWPPGNCCFFLFRQIFFPLIIVFLFIVGKKSKEKDESSKQKEISRK
jgi:hypothetical protein